MVHSVLISHMYFLRIIIQTLPLTVHHVLIQSPEMFYMTNVLVLLESVTGRRTYNGLWGFDYLPLKLDWLINQI